MSTHTMTTVECTCRTCKANAKRLGVAGPLRATVTEAFLAQAGAHTAVHMANDPIFGASFRAMQDNCSRV